MMIFKRFWQDETASMTLEFVAILPLMLFWFVGSIVFFNAYKAKMDAGAAAIVIADIVSRHSYVNPTLLEELDFLHGLLLPKASATWMRVTAIIYDEASDSYSVRWSEIPEGLTGSPMEDEDIPVDLLWDVADQEQLIIVDTVVPYVPLVDWVRIGARNWESRKIYSPRPERFIEWCTMADVGDCDATTT